MNLDRGTVVLIVLDPTVGHEQRGQRPCIAVSDPAVNADQRFPLIAVVPVTGTAGEGVLYPALSPGKSGLTKMSYALIDHPSLHEEKSQDIHAFDKVPKNSADAALFVG